MVSAEINIKQKKCMTVKHCEAKESRITRNKLSLVRNFEYSMRFMPAVKMDLGESIRGPEAWNAKGV